MRHETRRHARVKDLWHTLLASLIADLLRFRLNRRVIDQAASQNEETLETRLKTRAGVGRRCTPLRLLASLVTLSLLAGCQKSQPAPTLTLDWKPEPEFGGFYQAQSPGAFKAARPRSADQRARAKARRAGNSSPLTRPSSPPRRPTKCSSPGHKAPTSSRSSRSTRRSLRGSWFTRRAALRRSMTSFPTKGPWRPRTITWLKFLDKIRRRSKCRWSAIPAGSAVPGQAGLLAAVLRHQRAACRPTPRAATRRRS